MIKFNKLDYKILNHFKYVIMALAIMFLSVNTGSATVSIFLDNIAQGDCSGQMVYRDNHDHVVTDKDLWWNVGAGGYCMLGSGSWDVAGWPTGVVYNFHIGRDAAYYPFNKNISSFVGNEVLHYSENIDNEIGYNVYWDKTEYSKGEKGKLTITFNSTNFNPNKYEYSGYIVNQKYWDSENYPDYEFTQQNFVLTSSSNIIYYTFPDTGTYDVYLWISDKVVDVDQGIYSNTSYITASSLLEPQSFITWQYHDMDLGGLGTDGKISYGVSDSIWYFGSTISIEIFKDNKKVHSFDNLNNFGTVYYPLEESGTYIAKLVLYVSYVGTVYKEDIAYVNLPQSYIDTDKTEYYTNETIIFSGAKYPESAETGKYYVLISTIQSVAGRVATYSFESKTPYTFSGSLNLPIGAYGASLYGYSNQCVIEEQETCFRKKDTQEFVVKGLPDGSGKHFLNISWRKNESKLWDYAMLDYQNETASDFITIYDNTGKFFRKWDFSSSTYSGSILVPQDPSYIGVWTARITNGSNISQYKEDTINIISASQQNFSNNYSITMNWEKKENVKGNNKLMWNTGTYTGDYVLKLVNGITGVYLRTWEMETTNVKYNDMEVYLAGDIEQYTMQFISNNSKILASASIKIVENVDGDNDDNVDTGIGDDAEEPSESIAGQKMDQFVLILGIGLNTTSKLIFAVLMIAIVVCVMYISTRSIFVAVASGSAIFIWMLAISYIPLWVVILVAIVLILKARQGE